MRYQDIDSPITARLSGEAFKVCYVANKREVRRWLRDWNDGPRWSEQREDAIWVAPRPARAIRDYFGHYMQGVGRIRLFEREPSHNRLKEIVGRDYWNHIT